mmetsp:Transcript_8208/g.30833  ORF Transcript_8208/g.30833 Transcript_8208/m.30833 type:complete len:246 (-) Transcript_8208:679-1416(-)
MCLPRYAVTSTSSSLCSALSSSNRRRREPREMRPELIAASSAAPRAGASKGFMDLPRLPDALIPRLSSAVCSPLSSPFFTMGTAAPPPVTSNPTPALSDSAKDSRLPPASFRRCSPSCTTWLHSAAAAASADPVSFSSSVLETRPRASPPSSKAHSTSQEASVLALRTVLALLAAFRTLAARRGDSFPPMSRSFCFSSAFSMMRKIASSSSLVPHCDVDCCANTLAPKTRSPRQLKRQSVALSDE